MNKPPLASTATWGPEDWSTNRRSRSDLPCANPGVRNSSCLQGRRAQEFYFRLALALADFFAPSSRRATIAVERTWETPQDVVGASFASYCRYYLVL